MLRNMAARIKQLMLLNPQVVTATFTSASIDTKDFGSAMFNVAVASGFTFTGTNKIDLKLQVSDNNSDWTDAAQEDIYVGTAPIVKSLIVAGDAGVVHSLEYRGAHQYARCVGTVGGTVSVGVSVTALLGYSEFQPAL